MRGAALPLALALALLASCYSPHARRVNMGGGRYGAVVECRKQTDCAELADKMCPGGFDLLDRQTVEKPITNIANGQYMGSEWETTWRVACR